ncbi:hypothetical protein D3C71_1040070 [compost metagenome]
MQQRRAGVGHRLRAVTTVDGGRTGDVGLGGEATLCLEAGQRGAVLPAVTVAVVEHAADDQAVVQQRVTAGHHFGGGHVGGGLVGGREGLRPVDQRARPHARADPHQVGNARGVAGSDVEVVDAQRRAAARGDRVVVIVALQRAFHVGEARRRGIDQIAIHQIDIAHVLRGQGVAHQVAHLDLAHVGDLGQADVGRRVLHRDDRRCRGRRSGQPGAGRLPGREHAVAQLAAVHAGIRLGNGVVIAGAGGALARGKLGRGAAEHGRAAALQGVLDHQLVQGHVADVGGGHRIGHNVVGIALAGGTAVHAERGCLGGGQRRPAHDRQVQHRAAARIGRARRAHRRRQRAATGAGLRGNGGDIVDGAGIGIGLGHDIGAGQRAFAAGCDAGADDAVGGDQWVVDGDVAQRHVAGVGGGHGVGKRIAGAHLATGIGIAAQPLGGFQCGLLDNVLGTALHAGRIGIAAGQVGCADHVVQRAAGVSGNRGGVHQRIAARQRADGQDASEVAAAGVRPGGDHAGLAEPCVQLVDEEHRLGRGRARDHRGDGVGDGLALLHETAAGRGGTLAHRRGGRHHRMFGAAALADRRRIDAGRFGGHHVVAQRAGGVGIHGCGVHDGVGTRSGTHRQRAHQRIGGIAGVGTGAGDGHEAEAIAEGVGQRERLVQFVVGDEGGERELHHIARRHLRARCGLGALVDGDRGRGDGGGRGFGVGRGGVGCAARRIAGGRCGIDHRGGRFVGEGDRVGVVAGRACAGGARWQQQHGAAQPRQARIDHAHRREQHVAGVGHAERIGDHVAGIAGDAVAIAVGHAGGLVQGD